MKRSTKIGVGAVALAAIAVVGALTVRANDASADDAADNTVKTADAAPLDPAAVARGHQLAVAGDCAACHTAPGGKPYAGGHELQTPFGTIVSTNITPDRDTGIGNWTERDFFKAVRHGQAPEHMLYPAMPYTAYVQITDRDMHDLWAYFRSIAPAKASGKETSLPFPFNIRLAVSGWNLLFFDNRPFVQDNTKSAQWNQGHYLTDVLGHCGTCHTGKNVLGGDKSGTYLAGGTLQNWHAPDLTASPATGLAAWSQEDIVTYLRTGSNRHAVAAGPMAEAVEESTQRMTDAERQAIAGYLKSLPAHTTATQQPLAASDPAMVRGKVIFEASCSACHTATGQGIAGMATHLADNSAVRSDDPASLIHVVLDGARAARTQANPTGAGMPSYAWKLDDADVAAVLTYVRNSWGNAARPITSGDVADARRSLGARKAL
ncbi:cytochrome c [Novosphingobium sp. 1949]|uniref:Cytochrome c n=1 Tax=Novosphingobium organovorum TaxID=2930092 RepID=A0ABT0B875_9SPHN|nr:cytochrome c [Novosphingobium organovorum]MCJ2181270.1 cytochrome c [Novosphingobium organovorum]